MIGATTDFHNRLVIHVKQINHSVVQQAFQIWHWNANQAMAILVQLSLLKLTNISSELK